MQKLSQLRLRFPEVILAALCLLCACNAPRDNPHDPAGSNYVGPGKGSIGGKVTNLANHPIVSAFLLIIPGYHGAVTDDMGNYLIEEVEAGNYQVICSSTGFDQDTITTSVASGVRAEADFRLDAFPIVQVFQVTSRLNYIGAIPPYYYTVYARARVTDPDGFNDIATVLLHVDGLNDQPMSFNPDSSSGLNLFYSVVMTEEQFPSPFVDSIRFKDFSCSVTDTSGNSVYSAVEEVLHVFETWPTPLSPSYLQIISTLTPVLQWQLFTDGFANSIDVYVYRDVGSGNWQLAWQQKGLAPTDTSATVNPPLPAISGYTNYNWSLEVFDIYGNSSRSVETPFRIVQ
ncbi:MAG: carboxypeptidase-like regulatory domain-containing protein [bacterium]|nr:carboxypeptidase-like regulatory domain-containing protein [bacterium]